MPCCNFSNILCPIFPILTTTALLDDFGVNVVFPLLQLRHIKGKLRAIISFARARTAIIVISVITACYADNIDIVWLILVQFDAVDGIIESVIMRTECLQHIPYNFIFFIICKSHFRLNPSRNPNWQNDISVLLGFTFAHDTPYRLDNVYNGFPGIQEHNCIQCRNIYAFR